MTAILLVISLVLFFNFNAGNGLKVEQPVQINDPKPSILWSADFSPDGQFLAIGGDDKLLRVYNAKNHTLLNTYQLPSAVQCLDWNKDSKLLAIALDDKPVQILNIKTNNLNELVGTTGSRALSWNFTGNLLAIGDYEGTLLIWNNEKKLIKSIKKENTKTYLSVDWHPKKNIILTGGDRIRLFDTTGNLLQSIKHRQEETIILAVRWHPSGLFFATGDYGQKENGIESLLQFWNENGTLLKTLNGSKAEYRNIRWSISGDFIATASDALRIWSIEGQLIYLAKSDDLLWGIDLNFQNKNIITSSEKGKIKLWSYKANFIKEIDN